MSKTIALFRSSLLQLKLYFWGVLGFTLAGLLTNVIVSLSVGSDNNAQVSYMNTLTIFLLFVGSVLPVSLFKRVLNLGASRREYYITLIWAYMIYAALFALLNVLWLWLEVSFIHSYQKTFNILEIFHWDQFGYAGMFIYQFGVYLLLLSLLNLLFSGFRHAVGWIFWLLVVSGIPIFTSIPSLRHKLVDGLKLLLYNESLPQAFGISIVIACIFLAIGWWLTRRRTV